MPTFNDTHVESSQATALTVARGSGVTDYGLQVDESASSAATGLKITAAASGSGLALSIISPATNENVSLNAKGSGTVTIGGTSTGNVNLATGGGKVGIGTSSPSAALSVNSSTGTIALFQSSSSDGSVIIDSPGASTLWFHQSATPRYFMVAGTSNQNVLDFRRPGGGDPTTMRLDQNGNVGIGTTSPASRLDISNGALTMEEMTAPASPGTNKCVMYAEDDGAGKTRLMVRFATGAAVQLAIEP